MIKFTILTEGTLGSNIKCVCGGGGGGEVVLIGCFSFFTSPLSAAKLSFYPSSFMNTTVVLLTSSWETQSQRHSKMQNSVLNLENSGLKLIVGWELHYIL